MKRESTGSHKISRGRGNRKTPTSVATMQAQKHVARGLVRLVGWVVAGGALAATVAVAHFGWMALCTSPRLSIRTIDLSAASASGDQKLASIPTFLSAIRFCGRFRRSRPGLAQAPMGSLGSGRAQAPGSHSD